MHLGLERSLHALNELHLADWANGQPQKSQKVRHGLGSGQGNYRWIGILSLDCMGSLVGSYLGWLIKIMAIRNNDPAHLQSFGSSLFAGWA